MNGIDIKTYKILLSGRVQGVGYRYFIQEKAEKYEIAGYVRNIADNNVEIVCQGQQDMMEIFIAYAKKGPAFAHVTRFIINEIKEPAAYTGFKIEY